VGQSIDTWADRVYALVRDQAEVDVPERYAIEIGVIPAITQYSIDRPRVTAVDLPAAGRYLPFPTEAQGWQDGWSVVHQIEAPAGQTPPAVLLDSDWSTVRDATSPAIMRILLPAELEGETCRIVFTAAWPIPDANPSTDLIPPIGFEAICSLAAAMVCTSLSAEAARDRQGALPTSFVDGTDRARDLLEAARAFRTTYMTFIGLGSVNGSGGTGVTSSTRQLQSVAVRGATRRLSDSSQTSRLWPYRDLIDW